MPANPVETAIPLLQEHLRIGRRVRETGRVRVSIGTGTAMRQVEETLRHRQVEIERVPVGRTVAEAPPVREEGDTLVVPVLAGAGGGAGASARRGPAPCGIRPAPAPGRDG